MAGHSVGMNSVASGSASRKSVLVRNALAAGVAVAVFANFGAARSAPFFGFGPFNPGPRTAPADPGSRFTVPDRGMPLRPHYLRSYRSSSGTRSGKNSEKPPSVEVPKGTLQIVVSIGQQRVTLYSNGIRVAQSAVSTGVPGHPTPMGVFSVIQKDRYHHSNLYSNAPMPYMQRITWSGVAMHEGPLPGHPASHGCIRLTHDFAARLWTTTKLGVRVFVLRNDASPEDFSHPKLFQPMQKRPEIAASETSDDSRPAVVAQAGAIGNGTDAASEPSTPSGIMRNGVEPAVTAPVAMPAAVAQGSGTEPAKPDPAAIEPLKPSAPKGRNTEPPKSSGHIAVFVSRKEKKVFVRQGFEPLFDMPVEIANPDQPLGTHVFTALELLDGARMRWNVLSIANAEPRGSRRTIVRETRRGRRLIDVAPERPVDAKPVSTAAEALDRITLPQEAIDRISELLIPGSSLVISDYGLGGETGRSTEFIVVTR
jgi:lipoprotein-anchoring transpeptidase ErfK/SrfK